MIFYFRRAKRDSAKKLQNLVSMNRKHTMKNTIQLFYRYVRVYQQPTSPGSLPEGTTQFSNSFGFSPSSLTSPSSSSAAVASVSAAIAFVIVVFVRAGSSEIAVVPSSPSFPNRKSAPFHSHSLKLLPSGVNSV